jgi:hypothetical protein
VSTCPGNDPQCGAERCPEHPRHLGDEHTYEMHHSADDHVEPPDGHSDPGRCECIAGAPLTTVVFRRWYRQEDGTGIIALFPEDDEGRGMCSSYEHMGQHGAASYTGVVSRTRPATPDEYAALKRELENLRPYPYRLHVVQRRPGRQYRS